MSSAQSRRPATIFDVARLAGVSHQTVSRVLNKSDKVRPATRDRVEQAIQQLRYVPSQAARALVTRRTQTVGIVLGSSSLSTSQRVALGIGDAARGRGYDVLVAALDQQDASALQSATEVLLRHSVEGIVFVAVDAADAGLDLDAAGVPAVAAVSRTRGGIATIEPDLYGAGRAATEHLLTLGHRRIGHITSRTSPSLSEGWRAAMQDAGLPIDASRPGDGSADSGYLAALSLLSTDHSSALFASTDEMAIGAARAVRDTGQHVPHDVSVIGFGDIPLAAHTHPALTTIRFSIDDIAHDAAEMLFSLLRDDEQDRPGHYRADLILRESVGVPPPTDR